MHSEATRIPIADMHADIPLDVTFRRVDCRRSYPENASLATSAVVDKRHLEKLKAGGVSGFNAIVCVESKYKPNNAIPRGFEILDAFLEDLKLTEFFSLVTKGDEFQSMVEQGDDGGKIAAILGIEGGELIGESAALLRTYYRLGLRSFGYVWNERNMLADGYGEKERRNGGSGLSEFGIKILEECNRLGIILDGAHIAPNGLLDMLELSKDPIIVSHASTEAHPHTLRPLDDEMLKRIAKNGGVVGLFAINLRDSMPTLDSYVDHIEHAIKVAGADHVGLGFDFCDYIPETLDSVDTSSFIVSDIPGLASHADAQNVIKALRRRGNDERIIRKVAYENFCRVTCEVL